MRRYFWGGQTRTHLSDQRLLATVHLSLCKNHLDSKTGEIYESEWDGRTTFNVIGVEVYRLATAGEVLWSMKTEETSELAKLSPDEIRQKDPRLYNSIIYHFHSVKEVFFRKGIEYSRHEDLSPCWAKEVAPFLEEMSDEQIANVCKCTPWRIADIRLVASMTTSGLVIGNASRGAKKLVAHFRKLFS